MSDESERLFTQFLAADKTVLGTSHGAKEALAAYDRYAGQCRADGEVFDLDECGEAYRQWLLTVRGGRDGETH